METRGFPLEIKELSQAGEIVGLAAAFGNIDNGGDRIISGAFSKSLAEHKAAGSMPAMLMHHDLKRPCGVWTELVETNEGLLAKGRFSIDAADGREAYALTRDGAMRGLSVGYIAEEKSYVADARELRAVKLFEVSLVAVPMNDRTRVQSIKSIHNAKDIADLLREAGLSGRQAKAAAGAAWRSINETDDADLAAASALTGALARPQTI